MMPWAILGIFIGFLLMTYIIVQGTRAALAWRQAAAAGDVKVITDIVEGAIKAWSSQKRPREVLPEVWRGVQSMQLTAVTADFVGVSCVSESEYRMDAGRWVEIRNPLQAGFGIAVKVLDLMFYELPHHRPDSVQVDVYTNYRDQGGATERECILSVRATRDEARAVDWDEWTAEEMVRSLNGLYRLGPTGHPLPVEPFDLPEGPASSATVEAGA
jgi:hypothetical protein